MNPIALVAVGGVIGSLLRWQILEFITSSMVAVMVVNLLGTLVAAFCAYKVRLSPNQRLFYITGFAGGFTTFSSYAVLIVASSFISGTIYALSTLIVSLAIVYLMNPKLQI